MPSRTVEYRSEQHVLAAHRVIRVGIADDINEPATLVTLSFSRSISPQGKIAEPVAARQFEQWQLNAATNSSETS